MTNIQRQERIVSAAQRILSKPFHSPAMRSRPLRMLALFNEKRMIFAGYTASEAKASFSECLDIARLNLGAA